VDKHVIEVRDIQLLTRVLRARDSLRKAERVLDENSNFKIFQHDEVTSLRSLSKERGDRIIQLETEIYALKERIGDLSQKCREKDAAHDALMTQHKIVLRKLGELEKKV